MYSVTEMGECVRGEVYSITVKGGMCQSRIVVLL